MQSNQTEYTTPYTYTTIFVQTPLLLVFILHNYGKKQTQQIIITQWSMRFVFWLFKWIKRKIPRQLIGFIPLQVHISILINTTHDKHQQNSNCITIHSEMESKSIRNTASISLNWIVFALNLCDTFVFSWVVCIGMEYMDFYVFEHRIHKMCHNTQKLITWNFHVMEWSDTLNFHVVAVAVTWIFR